MELKGSSTTGRRTLDEEIHVERRRIFWQRVYSESLRAMLANAAPTAMLAGMSAAASSLAEQAVKDFDEWEETQRAQAPNEPPPAGDAGGGDEDDPDDLYLGR